MDIGKGQLFIGHTVDEEGTTAPLLFDSSDFTTHGVIVGMTGSGKTGLGITILEEALLNDVPCLIIDPKGDMGNLLLTFPEFAPDDFREWIQESEAQKQGVTAEELASETASKWKEGLAKSGIEPDRLKALVDGTEVTIYTPGSGAGLALNVLGSMKAPNLDWDTQAEVIRDEIEALVSSLLVIAGIESDPVAGPEHILLATIVEDFWRRPKDLDLATLVGQIPNPPFRKLGVFDVDTFFPEKERVALAMKLNGLLASPSFASWLEGDPLDLAAMLTGGDKTKAAVVYLTHLSDSERQFAVTLILSKLVTWFRSQGGTTDLRALVYMDEVFGFAPPTAEPPSKKPILTILKQARAHGVGMILSTQNPVDLDYKAMSNAGTWMVGRLQTENDKKRILEGIASAAGTVDVAAYDTLISDLEKRQFVLHSVDSPSPTLFDTRWAMSYLAGPLTRDQVSFLMADRARPEPEPETSGPAESGQPPGITDLAPVRTLSADGVPETFLDPAASWSGLVNADPTGSHFAPGAAATVNLLYDDTAAGVNHQEVFEAIVFPLGPVLSADSVREVDHDVRDFRPEAPDGASFETPQASIETKKFWTGLDADLKNHLVGTRKVTVFKNPELKLYSRPGETREDFIARAAEAAEQTADEALVKMKERYQARIDRARATLAKAENRVAELESAASSKQQEELLSGAGDLLGALLGGRKRSNPLGQAAKRRSATQTARDRAENAGESLDDERAEVVALEQELAEEIATLTEEQREKASHIEELEIPLEKTDIRVAELKLVWIPIS